MKGDDINRGAWSRREVFRVGGMATAAGLMDGIAVTGAAPASQQGRAPLPAASAKGPQVYTRIGVRPFINLTGTLTINGGALELPEVREACHQAADYAVDLDELMEKAGARIAELVGCEAAIVTSGAAAALSHATAACIVGTDPELMQQLPNLTGLRDEVTNGNRVEGSHIGRRLQGAVSGTIDGDRVRLRSSLPHEGTQLAYRFDGRVQGQTIEGEVDLGEYGTARWTARRVGQGS